MLCFSHFQPVGLCAPADMPSARQPQVQSMISRLLRENNMPNTARRMSFAEPCHRAGPAGPDPLALGVLRRFYSYILFLLGARAKQRRRAPCDVVEDGPLLAKVEPASNRAGQVHNGPLRRRRIGGVDLVGFAAPDTRDDQTEFDAWADATEDLDCPARRRLLRVRGVCQRHAGQCGDGEKRASIPHRLPPEIKPSRNIAQLKRYRNGAARTH